MKHFYNALQIVFVYLLLNTNLQANTIKNKILDNSIDELYAKNFSALIVQSNDGRMKPLDTMHLDIINKLTSKRDVYGLHYNQVILGMVFRPDLWQQVPLFNITHESIQNRIQIKQKNASFKDFFKSGDYALAQEVIKAEKVQEKNRNSYQKSVLKLHEKMEVMNLVLTTAYMKIYPLPKSDNNRWYSPISLRDVQNNEIKYDAQLLYVNNKRFVKEALESGNWSIAQNSIEKIKLFQKKHGEVILPSSMKQKVELFYNKILLFERLYGIYLLFGLILFVLSFVVLLKQSFVAQKILQILKTVIIVLFVLHTVNLGFRSYISGHAPWSDAYESMVFIAWAILFAGVIFSKRHMFALSMTTFLSGALMFGAHLNFIDPQITNLAVNLQTIWLTIHVAIISASYGFLALCALLGLVSCFLYLAMNEKNETNILTNLKQTDRVNEMSMIIGFVLLIIGTLLGSVWANESWGRIWGWDPKESWSLVSILIYMVILHLRMNKKLENMYAFAVVSVLAYFTIIMTYFGVNYFFDAIHVYASRSNSDLPSWVYVVLATIFVLLAIAYPKSKQLKEYE